jgi:NAD-dependent SIR2 family protein deacetylase
MDKMELPRLKGQHLQPIEKRCSDPKCNHVEMVHRAAKMCSKCGEPTLKPPAVIFGNIS